MRTLAATLISIALLAYSAVVVQAQNADTAALESIFYNTKYTSVQEGIRALSKKQALYAYNIANLTVPNFKPVLPKEDQVMLQELAGKTGYTQEVLLEFYMTRMTENSKRLNAYLTIWKSKNDALKRIVTMGK